MKGHFRIVLKVVLHALLIWMYTSLLVDLLFLNYFPSYVFTIFVLGMGLGYLTAKVGREKVV